MTGVHDTTAGPAASGAVGGALDAAGIAAALPAETRARIGMLQVLEDTDSTQADALAAPAPADARCAVFIARRQHAGHGRRGRTWVSGDGNLALSLSRRLARPLRDLSGLSLAAGVAVVDALASLGVRVAGLKWPNDIVADQRKLGGLLVDARADGDGSVVVVGVGVNVSLAAAAADGIAQPWCDLAGLGHAIDRGTLAAAVIDRLVAMLDVFERDGLAPFLSRWAQHDAYAGRDARVLDGAREYAGTVLGITGDGALRLRTGDGEQCFHAGELSLRAR